ncbi:MAG: DUF4956 domain-containing protein [Oscillospiraceae bacterium]
MLETILAAGTGSITFSEIMICTGISLALGLVIAGVYMYRNTYSKNFVVTIALLPALIQAVIMLVNGNLGTGVAVMGAFSLVRFRSAPGSAREIASIFFAMAVGLATGMGYIAYAGLFTLVIAVAMLLYAFVRFGEQGPGVKNLRVTIPEDVDYEDLFDDLFAEYTKRATLEKVKTTNLGSLYELQYTIELKKEAREKEMIDRMRQRNGNLNIVCGRIASVREEL